MKEEVYYVVSTKIFSVNKNFMFCVDFDLKDLAYDLTKAKLFSRSKCIGIQKAINYENMSLVIIPKSEIDSLTVSTASSLNAKKDWKDFKIKNSFLEIEK